MSLASCVKNCFSFFELKAILGRLIVTTPILPVMGFAPKSPPPFLRSSLLSMRSLQHMDLTSLGSISLLTKLAKYGIPYLPVISHTLSRFLSSQLKSLPILYVGIGKVNILPSASPSA